MGARIGPGRHPAGRKTGGSIVERGQRTGEAEAAGRTRGTSSVTGCLVRVGWMVAGNAALAMLAVTIMLEPSWTITAKDAVFWSFVGVIIGLRYVDVAWLGGLTADGTPATRQHLVRHAVVLAGISVLLWTAVQSVHFRA
jgi:hypothetical protein